jgi:hypothetical protein
MYFIECGLSVGALVGRPTFRQVFGADAKREIGKIDLRLSREITMEALTTKGEVSDTVRALNNLFQRKRKNGVARAAIFGGVAVASLIGIITFKPSTVTVNQQVVEVDSAPTADYVLLGVSAVMLVTGVIQDKKYSSANLSVLLEERKQGMPIPIKIKSKFKAKDFK